MADTPKLLQRRFDRRWVGNADNEQPFHSIRAERHRTICGRGSPIMPDDDGVTGAERLNQRKRIARQGLLIRVAIRDRARVVPPHKRTDRAVSLGGDSRAKIVPGVRCVRESVKHEHERPRTLLEIGEFQAIRVDEGDRISHGLGTLRQSSRRWARTSSLNCSSCHSIGVNPSCSTMVPYSGTFPNRSSYQRPAVLGG